MLSNLFQDSDYILYQGSGADKRPTGFFISKASVAPLFDNPVYYAINPIDPHNNRNERGSGTPRASINVTAFRNFLFEIDGLPLDQQEPLLRGLHTRVPLAQVTFSGSSSLHAIISVADTLPFKPHTTEGIAQYSQAWSAINAELLKLSADLIGPVSPKLFDVACKDPARLSRTPGSVRPDTNTEQSELAGFGGYVSSDDVLNLINKHATAARPYVTNSDSAPVNETDKGQLTKRTLNFINNWNPSLAHVWDWHSDFIFAVKDLQSQNYSMLEAQKILTTITGHLDSNDLYQLRDIWGRDNFKLEFRKRNKA